MKKLLLFVIACTLGLFGTVSAQETITIGNEEEAIRSYSVPFDLYNGYGVCQQLYTADEIGKTAGAIESLALKFVGPTDSDMKTPANQDQVVVDFEIYVENTTMTTLSAFQVVETGDLYFSGKQPMESDAWTTFEFSNSFEYDGTNLLITIYCVGDKYEMKTDNNYYPFYIYSTNDVQCLSGSPQDKPIAGVSFGGLNENSGKNILQLTFAAGEGGGEEPEPTPDPEPTPEPGDDLASEFSFDFEDGTLEGWNVFQDAGATSNNWAIGSGAYYGGVSDGKCVYSMSYGSSSLVAKNYIVTAEAYQITEESVLSWWIKHTYPGYETYDPYAVVVSTDGENFEQVADYTPVTGNTEELSLAAYAGQNLYIGFYHHGKGGDAICIDNIKLAAGEGGGEEPEPTPVAPAAPTNVVATADGQNSIIVTWDAVDGAAYYIVYKDGQMWDQVNGTTYTSTGLTAGTEYCYAVQAYDANDLESELSETVCATTEEEIEEPTPEPEPTPAYVEIGTGDNETMVVPVNMNSGYSYSQQLYTAQEIGIASGDITGVSFKVNSGFSGTRTVDVYMKHTEKTAFVDSYTYEKMTEDNKVFSGNFVVEANEGQWAEIVFDTPFAYEGGNFVISINDYTASNPGETYFCTDYLEEYKTLYYYPLWNGSKLDPSNMSGKGYGSYHRNIVRFALASGEGGETPTPEPVAPAMPVVTYTATQTTVTLTWEAVDGATEYNIYTPDDFDENVLGLTETTYTFENLTAATQYCFKVSAVNAVDESDTTEICATTEAATEEPGEGGEGDENGVITIGAGGEIQEFPFSMYEFYGASQQLFTAEEIKHAAGNIESFALRFFGETYGMSPSDPTDKSFTRTWQVYVQNTELTEIKAYQNITTEDLYFSGTCVFTAGEWTTFEFASDFEYEGKGILITMFDLTGKRAGGNYYQFYCDMAPNNAYHCFTGNPTGAPDTEYDGYGLSNTFMKNQIQLTFAAGEGGETPTPEPEPTVPAAPQNVVATPNGFNSIIVTWEAVENADYYYVYKDGQMWDQVNGTIYTINGLEMGQEYCFAVQAVNDGGESELSETACAKTASLTENQIVVGESTMKYLTPFVTALDGAWVEMIYKADEIGKAGKIAEIAYSWNSGDEVTADVNIYLAEVTKSEFANPNTTPESELTLVYSGTGITLCDSAWETFVLDTQFEYSGENNLLVVVATSNPSSTEYNYWNCYGDANTVLIKDTPLINKKPVMMLTLAEDGETPEPTPTFTHRLESVATGWGNTAYTYDEVNTNTVVSIDEDGFITEVTYNEAGQIASAVATVEDFDEEGNPIEVVISGVEYEYDENGVWTSYIETVQGWFGGTVVTETALNYDAEGRLVSLTSEELVRTIAYNEAGLISEVMEGYVVVEEGEEEEGEEEGDDNGIAPLSETEVEYEGKMTFEYDAEGRLVKKNYYYYDAYETMEFYWAESEVYTYDENGNCVKKESYEVTEENELNSFPYSVAEYIYDLTISNEDVYSFEYPHFAFINYVEPSYVNILVKEKSFYSYYDEDVEDVVSHSYDVTAYNYNPAVLSLPEKPMNLTAEVLSATEVELAWAGFPDAESFTLYSADTVFAEGIVEPYYTVENLEMGVEYCFAVMATNSVGNSEVSETACVTIELPAAPANLVAKAISETEIALTWEEVPGIWSYNVYQVVETAEETTYELLGEAWWGEYTVSELTAATEYSFVVTAVDVVGESAASNVATATTLAPPAPQAPEAPVVTATVIVDTVRLTWEAVEGALYYNLYYSGKLLSEKFEETTVDIQVPKVGTYCFTVTAVNEIGESEHSDEVCAEVVLPEGMVVPAVPVLEATLEEDAEGAKIIFSWEAVEGATGYNLYAENAGGQLQYLGTATMEDLPLVFRLDQEGGRYCFYLTAQNLAGESDFSEAACVTYGDDSVEENEASFNIYPNPVSDRLVIETEANIEAVTIYTVTGVVVYSEVDYNNNTIDVSDFANGVYIMKVRTDNGEAVQRFIKK